MARDLRDVVQRIKEQADAIDIVGRVVTLRKSGGRFWGLCPFHPEKSPSFCVRPERAAYHCFGCGAGGSMIDFVMKTEHLEFLDAVKKLARELRIEMPEFRPEEAAARDEEDRRRRDIEAANVRALKFFREALAAARNPLANEYLPKRNLTPELIEKFQLGAALDEWSALGDTMLREGFSQQLLADAGLITIRENGSITDRFRNRLIFPIFDHNNRVVGFGGRALVKDERTPKYLNSAETALYKKSRLLYALNLAWKPIQEAGHAILCEGYMDVVTAHAAGFTNAVASLGTALTPEQAKLLRRFTGRVHFLYDGDDAGRKAMLRGGDSLLAAGLDTRVITLPPEDDPDTFLLREGPEPLRERIRDAREFFDFALDHHAAQLDLRTIAGQAQLVESMAPIIRIVTSELLREAAITRLQTRVPGIPRQAIANLIAKAPKEPSPRLEAQPSQNGDAPPLDEDGSPFEDAAARPPDRLERGILKLMIESEEALEFVRARLHHEWLSDLRLEPWIFWFLDRDEPADALLAEVETNAEAPADRTLLNEIVAWEVPLSKEPLRDAEELLLRIAERHRLRIARELLERFPELGTEEERARLLAAYHAEHRQRHDATAGRLRVRR